MTRAGEGQLSLFPPEPAPDPLLCWLWLAGTLGAGSQRAGAVLDAFGGAKEAWDQGHRRLRRRCRTCRRPARLPAG